MLRATEPQRAVREQGEDDVLVPQDQGSGSDAHGRLPARNCVRRDRPGRQRHSARAHGAAVEDSPGSRAGDGSVLPPRRIQPGRGRKAGRRRAAPKQRTSTTTSGNTPSSRRQARSSGPTPASGPARCSASSSWRAASSRSRCAAAPSGRRPFRAPPEPASRRTRAAASQRLVWHDASAREAARVGDQRSARSASTSSTLGSQAPAATFARTCSGFVAPAMTQLTAGIASRPPTATSSSEIPRSSA